MPLHKPAQFLLFFMSLCSVNSAPTTTPYQDQHTSHSISSAHLAVIVSIAATLAILYAMKMRFLQTRASAVKVQPTGLPLNCTPADSPGGASMPPPAWKGSPILLGFLGSPARELGYVASDLLRLAPSGRLLKRRYAQHPVKQSMRMAFHWVKPPGQKPAERSYRCPSPWGSVEGSPKLPFQHASGTCPIDCTGAELTPGGAMSVSEMEHSRIPTSFERTGRDSRRLSKSYILDSEPAYEGPSSLYGRDADRRHLDTSNVNRDLDFSASLVTNEGNAYSPWLASLQLGHTTDHTFLEDLESSSPMPLSLRFCLPSPLLPAKKKPGPSKRRSPLRSILLPQSLFEGGAEASPNDDETPKDPFCDVAPTEDGKAESYKEFGLGRPSQSPTSLYRREAETESAESPTLELMLEQLVQVTSDWDDSITVDDKFKNLLESTRRRDQSPGSELDALPGATDQCPGSPPPPIIELPELDDLYDEGTPFPNPFGNSPHILRDRTRDLLFSIPEEEAISFSEALIQTY